MFKVLNTQYGKGVVTEFLNKQVDREKKDNEEELVVSGAGAEEYDF